MEYQYYEFQAIDRPLTSIDKDYVCRLSSRAKPTATCAVFTYSHGDFQGDPLTLLDRCFDAMLYEANWGQYQLAFRFPKSAINLSDLEVYCFDYIVEAFSTSRSVILNIQIDSQEHSRWIQEDESCLSDLIPLRQAILQGDYRVLYLAWLQAAAVSYSLEKESKEPPVPPNLGILDPPLQTFVNWLEIDSDLVTIAAQGNLTQQDQQEPFADWIKALSESEKEQILLKIVTAQSTIASQLQAQLRQKFAHDRQHLQHSGAERRSVAALMNLASTHRAERKSQERATAKAKRRQYLETLKSQKANLWEVIQDLIARKQVKPYEQAVQYLVDLRDLAALEGEVADFQSRIKQMKADYSNRPGLLRRIRDANLLSTDHLG